MSGEPPFGPKCMRIFGSVLIVVGAFLIVAMKLTPQDYDLVGLEEYAPYALGFLVLGAGWLVLISERNSG